MKFSNKVIIEWSVLYPGMISASIVLHKVLWFTRKKSSLQCTTGFLCRHVNPETSGFNTLQASTKSRLSQKLLIISSDFFMSSTHAAFFILINIEYQVKVTTYDYVFAVEIEQVVED